MPIHPADYDACRMLILDLQALQSRAHRIGMVLTAHALNEAMNKAGWELAEDMEANKRKSPVTTP